MLSSGIWRILVAVVLGAHGIEHILFLVPFLGVAGWGIWEAERFSWVRAGVIGLVTMVPAILAAAFLLR